MAENQDLNPEQVPETPEAAAAEEKEPKRKKNKKEKAGDAQELAALQQKLDESDDKAQELNNRLLRTAAEYENFRKRSQKEQDAAFNNGVAHAAVQLLPVLDTLDAAAQAETTDEEYKKGVLMTLAKCQEVFKCLGIAEIEAFKQPFDPELHNAVMQQPAEGCECGTVTQVMQKGYKMGDKVIRHAMVAVAP